MKGVVDRSDELFVIPDARAARLQRRLEQLRRFDNWLQGLTPWQRRLLPLALGLLIGCFTAWVNSLLPPVNPDQLLRQFWLGP
jgi:hypothetical protein